MAEKFYTIGELSRTVDCPPYHISQLVKRGVIIPDGENGNRALFSERGLPHVRRALAENPSRSASRRMFSPGMMVRSIVPTS